MQRGPSVQRPRGPKRHPRGRLRAATDAAGEAARGEPLAWTPAWAPLLDDSDLTSRPPPGTTRLLRVPLLRRLAPPSRELEMSHTAPQCRRRRLRVHRRRTPLRQTQAVPQKALASRSPARPSCKVRKRMASKPMSNFSCAPRRRTNATRDGCRQTAGLLRPRAPWKGFGFCTDGPPHQVDRGFAWERSEV